MRHGMNDKRNWTRRPVKHSCANFRDARPTPLPLREGLGEGLAVRPSLTLRFDHSPSDCDRPCPRTTVEENPIGQRQALPAFTLIEVMMALGIFAIGFVAIAAPMFVAVKIQAETIDDVLVRQVERSAIAMLKARAPTIVEVATELGYVDSAFDDDGKVYEYPAVIPGNVLQTHTHLYIHLADRSYPSDIADLSKRRYYWTVWVRDNNTQKNTKDLDYDFHFYLVIFRRGASDPVPPIDSFTNVQVANGLRRFDLNGNANTSGSGRLVGVRPGDQVLDEFGGIYGVLDADGGGFVTDAPIITTQGVPTIVYFLRPPNDLAPSPIRSIRLLSNIAQ